MADIFQMRWGAPPRGWNPRLRSRFGYHTPDEHYESVVASSVTSGCRWLDVGAGRSPFPTNPTLAQMLADRCGHLAGLDPDATLDENPYVHERVRALPEQYWPETPFDLVTCRMVAEHVADPAAFASAISRLVRPGGSLVLLTVDALSPLAWAARLVPHALHHPVKAILWGTEARDTFPVCYRMNSRRALGRLFAGAGLVEDAFWRLADCRTFYRWRMTQWAELATWRTLGRFGLGYPEACLLGLYRRIDPATEG